MYEKKSRVADPNPNAISNSPSKNKLKTNLNKKRSFYIQISMNFS